MSLNTFREQWRGEVDAASGAAFRIAFGTLMVLAVLRYYAMGWVDDLWITPQLHFPYFGAHHIGALPPVLVHGLFAATALAALAIALGAWTRVASALFFVSFSALELFDRSTYLNHYYLISMLGLLMVFMPLGRHFSLESWWRRRRGEKRRIQTMPRWVLSTLRLQLGVVYFFAGVAKLRSDWLFRAQPLRTWLARHTDLPLVGSLMDDAWVAFAMSWAGMLFDISIFFFLLNKKTRLWAYLVVVGFHLATGALFHIGVFPYVMIALTPIFFDPSWPRRVWAKLGRVSVTDASQGGVLKRGVFEQGAPQDAASGNAPSSLWRGVLIAWFAVQLLVPLRRFLYPGNTCWTEEGFRFAWQVMLIEKTGQVDFIVRDAVGETVFHPREVLTPLQMRYVPTQPDMVLSFAHYLHDRWVAEGRGAPEVRAEVWVSLNGRRAQLMIDPEVDLAQVEYGWLPRTWIFPLNDEAALAHEMETD